MIRAFKIWLACRRLNRLIAKRRRDFDVIDYGKRRKAALKHTRGLA